MRYNTAFWSIHILILPPASLPHLSLFPLLNSHSTPCDAHTFVWFSAQKYQYRCRFAHLDWRCGVYKFSACLSIDRQMESTWL